MKKPKQSSTDGIFPVKETNKPASLLVVPLGKALSGISPSWCGRQMAGNS